MPLNVNSLSPLAL